jgi:hypothetical protein
VPEDGAAKADKEAVLKACQRMCEAIRSEDLKALLDCSPTVTGDFAALRDATARGVIARERLYHRAKAKFGKDAEKLALDFMQDAFLDAWIAGKGVAEVRVVANRAEVSSVGQCIREGKTWKMDFAGCEGFRVLEPEVLRRVVRDMDEEATTYEAIVAELEQGKLTTLEEVVQAEATRVNARGPGGYSQTRR